jgi:hypothetical protein
MLDLCCEKHCWLSQIDEIPAEELSLWAAYYQIKDIEHKRLEQEIKSGARRR